MDSSALPEPPAVLMAPRTNLEGSAVPTPRPTTGPWGSDLTLGIPWPPAHCSQLPHGHPGAGRGPAALAPHHVPTAAELATGPAPGSPLLVPPIRSRARLRVKETTLQPL